VYGVLPHLPELLDECRLGRRVDMICRIHDRFAARPFDFDLHPFEILA
jgi:hypothetical protein